MLLAKNLQKLPHVRHGFFDKTLPTGEYVDQRHNLIQTKNQLNAENIVRLYQTHSSIVHTINTPPKARLIGDALITTQPSLAICIRTADCAPILIAHKSKPIIAAIHTGWRGVILGKIIENTAQELQKLDNLKNYIVALGPCLHQKNFQAGPAIYNNISSIFINKKNYFDFPSYIKHKFNKLGFVEIETILIDTYDNPNFFSYRHATHQSKSLLDRQNAAICLI
ncbi:MAG: polyphenol oxidase family protein [Alphaproteobacteria bacterium]|nr:MAG: polyphenol oxidase family protein [Alphaproteobacteria bacterium]